MPEFDEEADEGCQPEGIQMAEIPRMARLTYDDDGKPCYEYSGCATDEFGSMAATSKSCFSSTVLRTLGAMVVVTLVVLAVSSSNLEISQADSGKGVDAEARETALHEGDTLVYFGNGCFWERQYAMANIEMGCSLEYKTPACNRPFHREPAQVSSVVGYAGGKRHSRTGEICYHHTGDSIDGTQYEELGYGEAVQVRLDANATATQYAALLQDYFSSFKKDGSRPDPMDRGGAYRSFLGIPGGLEGELYPLILNSSRAFGSQMTLAKGSGNEVDVKGQDLRDIQIAAGHIDSTGCPEAQQHW
ncbi:hypothetical protein CYMTET_47544 [Cymbomonas tetramitiformis]|uniref:Peptide-methionine (S)-S-oxide reductase n=1 Tax=Cymbomonas tetramitiformis TaxID=36881 RepID=A0AAE0EVW3_9CHLO|nr:hypothetical protein CYMTET_47544 [Cymbomonas tetramitiformis]